ncbi:MAG: radical SAM protein [Planctomycetota bacterium]|nr:radical SAM protein [Planctomycetota bacterium]
MADKPRYRYERFGGILATNSPAMLAYVDRELMKSLGLPDSPLWEEAPREVLSAPTEAHMLITRRCPLQCSHCYTDSSPDAGEDLSFEEVSKRIDSLAAMKVFHLAMGGGEAFLRDDLLDIARYARARGVTPNLTTNGQFMTAALARECAGLFGQINLSVDGVSLGRREPFGEDKTQLAEVAVAHLVDAGVQVGFNVVVTRETYDELDAIAAFAKKNKVCDIELLRYKPAGRGTQEYLSHRLEPEQRTELFPKVLKLTEKYQIPIKLDCSSAPFVCHHSPDKERMEAFDVMGCIGGISLLGADEQGRASACSFYPDEGQDILNLDELWENPESFKEFREYPENAAEPCRSCEYLSVCRGGCRAVARFLTGDPWAPDPECPKVSQAQATNMEV